MNGERYTPSLADEAWDVWDVERPQPVPRVSSEASHLCIVNSDEIDTYHLPEDELESENESDKADQIWRQGRQVWVWVMSMGDVWELRTHNPEIARVVRKIIKSRTVRILMAQGHSPVNGTHWHILTDETTAQALIELGVEHGSRVRSAYRISCYMAKNAQQARDARKGTRAIECYPKLPEFRAKTRPMAVFVMTSETTFERMPKASIALLVDNGLAVFGKPIESVKPPIGATVTPHDVAWCYMCKQWYATRNPTARRCKVCQRRYDATRPSGGKRQAARERKRKQAGMIPMW